MDQRLNIYRKYVMELLIRQQFPSRVFLILAVRAAEGNELWRNVLYCRSTVTER